MTFTCLALRVLCEPAFLSLSPPPSLHFVKWRQGRGLKVTADPNLKASVSYYEGALRNGLCSVPPSFFFYIFRRNLVSKKVLHEEEEYPCSPKCVCAGVCLLVLFVPQPELNAQMFEAFSYENRVFRGERGN